MLRVSRPVAVRAAVRAGRPSSAAAAAGNVLRSSRSPAPFAALRLASPPSPHLKSARFVWTSFTMPTAAVCSCTARLQQVRRYAEMKEQVVKVPQMAESISEGTLKAWNKNVGEFVKQDEEVVSIETDKVDVAVNAPFSGIIKEVYAKEEDLVTVGADLFKLEASEAGGATASAPAPKVEAKRTEPKQEEAPAPKEAVPQNLEKVREPTAAAPAAPKQAAAQGFAQSMPIDYRSEQSVKMTRMRKTIASRLKESQNVAASLTTFNEVDMTNLMDLRSTYKELVLKQHGVKLGFMSAFTKAVCHALKAVPVVNATIEGDSILYRDYMDISVAVATPKGLVTPVVRNAERMTIMEVEKEIAALGAKARDNKITLEDLTGGTFTISNGGIFGSLMGTPIINLPQSAILGMHAVKERPVAVGGQVMIRPMMYLALTYDHRLIDGREAVTFLVKVKEAIEDPRRLLLDV